MADIAEISDGQIERMVSFIRKSVKNAKCEGVVVGLSGGLDSAVVTKLATLALGKNVLSIFMPTDSTPKSDFDDTEKFSRSVGAEYKVVNIQGAVDELVSGDDDPIDRGNCAARIRMTVLFNNARKRKYLVLGTSNKSEIMVGYFTKFGDGACDLCVLSGLYKTQVREVAKKIGIPAGIIKKAPTAGLWDGQTDEGDLGVTYDKLDIVLSNLETADEELAELAGISGETIAKIKKMVSNSEHKRTFPAHPE